MSVSKYKVKYKNKTFLGNSDADLINNITHRFPDAPKEQIEDVVKRLKIENESFAGNENKDLYVAPEHRGSITFKDAMKGAAAIVRVMVGQVVPQQEINRRALTCSACVNLTTTSDCVGCGFGSRLIDFTRKIKRETFQKDFSIPENVNGKYCGVCSCALLAMLPSKMSAFAESDQKQAERPMHCWVKKQSPNYKE